MGVPVEAARFADQSSVNLGFLNPRTGSALSIPADNSSRPWRLSLPAASAITLCGLAAPSPAPPPATAAAPDLARMNLQLSDLPAGWRLVSPPQSPPATRLFDCMGLTGRASASAVAATGPGNVNVISELDWWGNPVGPRHAAAALRQPAGADCLRSAIEDTFKAVALPLTVSLSPMPPPAEAGRGAVAYAVSRTRAEWRADGRCRLGPLLRQGRHQRSPAHRQQWRAAPAADVARPAGGAAKRAHERRRHDLHEGANDLYFRPVLSGDLEEPFEPLDAHGRCCSSPGCWPWSRLIAGCGGGGGDNTTTTATAAAAPAGGGAAESATAGVYVGEVGGTNHLIALVTDGGTRVSGAYLCIPQGTSQWIKPAVFQGGQAALVARNGTVLGSAKFSGDTATGTIN